MAIKEWLVPKFWQHRAEAEPYASLFNYRWTWKLAIALLLGASLVPLIISSTIDYNLTKRAIVSENLLRTSRVTSNTRRTISYFLEERLDALEYTIQELPYESLIRPGALAEVLDNLKKGFGGYVDLGLINVSGRQVSYAGPYNLEGRDYSGQEWFLKTREHGFYVSEVFMGFRNVPHMIIAVRREDPEQGMYILRATLDSKRLNDILADLDLSVNSDAFIINTEGVLQTPSRQFGDILTPVPFQVPEYSEKTQVYETETDAAGGFVVGYAYIQSSPFILMIAKDREELMKPWFDIRFDLVWFLLASVSLIVVVMVGVATYMINKIYIADETRAMTLHQMEFTNRLASIGRLAAGVAHEINNPLAVISEKTGLIKDLITYRDVETEKGRLLGMLDSVLSQVERCGTITKRLLGFARHIEVRMDSVDLVEVVHEVLGFLHKEAEYRDININLNIEPETPSIITDKGKVEQILLNLVNNSFQAMQNGGHLDIAIAPSETNWVELKVKDDGSGISEENLKRIFDPFFSTRVKSGGTGLGLSITYGLVQELGGKLEVWSKVGRGTMFTIQLPLSPPPKVSRNGGDK